MNYTHIIHSLELLSDGNGRIVWIVEEEVKMPDTNGAMPQQPTLQCEFWTLHRADDADLDGIGLGSHLERSTVPETSCSGFGDRVMWSYRRKDINKHLSRQ